MHFNKIVHRSFWLGLALVLPVWSQTITSVAGNSSWGDVQNLSLDSAGNIYVPDPSKHVVYKTDKLGVTTTVAGTGTRGYSGDGALAINAQLSIPGGTAVAPDGTLYITEYGSNHIRKVAPNGIITTIAGTGTAGFTGDGGPAISARIYAPYSIVLDSAGNLYFVDIGNYRVRKITPAGIITTVAGSGKCPILSGDGGPATAADSCPGALALGPDGSIYFTDDGDLRYFGFPRVRRVAPDGTISTVAGTGTSGYSGDGGPAVQAKFVGLSGVAVDSAGNLYISDGAGDRIRKVDSGTGFVNTFAGTGVGGSSGDGGPALKAQINEPAGMVFDNAGNLFFADRRNLKVRKISPPPLPSMQSDVGEPAFGGKSGFGSNTYMAIKGSNLAQTIRTWTAGDFNGPNAPTTLDGVSVTVNGKPAFIYYISPTQININTPEDTAVGPVQFQVKNSLGFSNIATAVRSRLAPALETIPQFLVGGKQYVVAYTPDFQTFIGTSNLVSGLTFAPAKPGQTIVIFAIGCGPTNPATQAGVAASQNSSLSLPYELKIGGVKADVTFAGLLAGTIGLYQFNITVPNVPAGDQPIELTIDGVKNNQNLVVTIGQ